MSGFGLGGAHSLALIPHVALLVILVFWEVHVRIMHGDQWTSEAVNVPDSLEAHCSGGKPCRRMEVSHCAGQDWEIIHIVDGIPF